jgi:pyruvate,orthophosphate dikinase
MKRTATRTSKRVRPSKTSTRAPKYVYFFAAGKAEGSSALRHLLGGKGCELAEMTNLGVPVPPGFTITTQAWAAYHAAGGKHPPGLWSQVVANLARLEGVAGNRLGHAERPLLVSVRSGARASMPGMMDTVLNLGLNDQTVEGLARWTKNERFAWDCYRRFLTIFGDVVLGIERKAFDELLERAKAKAGAKTDADVPAPALRELVAESKLLVQARTGQPFPPGPDGAAPPGHQCRVRLLVREEGGGLPAHPSSVRRLGHRGDRDGDGLRQHRRDVGYRRLLLARSVVRGEALLR